jgi:hypothetical protein
MGKASYHLHGRPRSEAWVYPCRREYVRTTVQTILHLPSTVPSYQKLFSCICISFQ